jgi:hypothetical protein
MKRKRGPGRVAPRAGPSRHPDNNTKTYNGSPSESLAVAPPTHFACASCYVNGKRHRIAIWNGVRDFASPPPPALIKHMDMSGKIIIKRQ